MPSLWATKFQGNTLNRSNLIMGVSYNEVHLWNFNEKIFFIESQFGGMALCTNEGIRFIVNTKEPYTGAIYAAEKFSTCSQVVENAKQISITFPPPNISPNCGTTIKVLENFKKYFILIFKNRMENWKL